MPSPLPGQSPSCRTPGRFRHRHTPAAARASGLSYAVAPSVTSLSGVRAEDSGAGVFQTTWWTSGSLGLRRRVGDRWLALLDTLVLTRGTAREAADVSAGGDG
ncbi:hypothetical protein [Streptosporangium saharense]|uniref:hypothetical protein n=1 Tax=Streptosporangium saharense TaxID=1706840 RepID=UPI0033349BEA